MRQPTNHDRPKGRKPERRFGAAPAPNRPVHRVSKGAPQQPVGAVAADAGAGKQRIAKVIARAGLCSRREAEAWIEQGRVSVNGAKLTSPALNVDDTDQILVDDAPLAARQRTRLFLFHKPRGYVTTSKDPQNRPTVFDILPKDLPRLISIGRLDINTQGLLLLTNDGGLARVLELPQTGWLRRYRVRANGTTDQAALDKLAEGITLEGMNYGPIEAKLDRIQGANVWLTMGLREGKNREVKRVLESLGLIVNRLIRISFGPFQLLDLAEGAVAEVNARVLKEQLGEALALAAQADFESPKMAASSRTRRPSAPAAATSVEPDAPRRERPEKGKRKHISVLRAERRAAALQPRKIERDATADRRGREIQVERLVAVGQPKHGSKQRSARHPAPRSTAARIAGPTPPSGELRPARAPRAEATAPTHPARERPTVPGRSAFTADHPSPVHRQKSDHRQKPDNRSRTDDRWKPDSRRNTNDRQKTGDRCRTDDRHKAAADRHKSVYSGTETDKERFGKARPPSMERAQGRAGGRFSAKAPRHGKDETLSRQPSKGRGLPRPGRNGSAPSKSSPRRGPSKRPQRTPP